MHYMIILTHVEFVNLKSKGGERCRTSCYHNSYPVFESSILLLQRLHVIHKILIVPLFHLYPIIIELIHVFINPLSPSINIQILQTDLHTFP